MDNQNSEHRIVDTAENKGGLDTEITEYDRLLAELAPPKCPILPKSDLVLVVQDDAADKVGQIYVPDTVKNKPHRGIIVAVGPGYLERETGQFLPMKTMVGERVLFGQYSGTPFRYMNQEFLLMRESDLYGSIPPFSIEELRVLKELKDVADAEVNRLAELRAKHLNDGGSIDTLPTELATGEAAPEPAASSSLSLDTNVGEAKKERKSEPKLKGRRGR